MNKITDMFLLKSILLEIAREGRKFDILDYYDLTDVPIWNILLVLEKKANLTSSERMELRKIIKVNQKIYASSPPGYLHYGNFERFKASRFSEYMSVGGIEITDEMKDQALNYLLEKGYPILVSTYRAVIIKMVNQMKEDNLSR